ncbi:unnamed protein product [Didymodactylos carnosus]|uniref:Uncharacterized protein n=1 Tax=Didymodactylos carnosus TaxID=1234261 RepID=A0A815PE81_9BILA|nr:unnamed protein product [Didymodactylos carnosus]CAF1448356.1 unnamed protein product [Didymodactylos carnosus]CAF4145045.1 unnamed protein product [Didymodactylos carnosus]CAF4322544.1 unnamed protein product [Didymodactylos carnosus]
MIAIHSRQYRLCRPQKRVTKKMQIAIQTAAKNFPHRKAVVHIKFSLEKKKIVVASSVTGPMHLRFTSTLPLDIIMQDKHRAQKMMALIKDIFELLKRSKLDVKKSEEAEYITQLSKDAKRWGSRYSLLFGVDEVTPYVHVLSAHIGEFYRIFQNLNKFTLQEVEELNDLMTQDYFRGSNKKGNYFTQMLRKRICELLLALSVRMLTEIRIELGKTPRVDASTESSSEDELL